MATRTIARMFDSYADASAAVRDLESAGFSHDDISLVGNRTETGGEARTDDASDAGSAAGTGATIGTLIGGGAGLLAGIGSLAIPGIGPIVAAGWLVAALTGAGVGAAAGGLLGGLTGAGVSEDEAHVYAEGVRRGGTLVTVRADETRATEVEQIMLRHNPVDVGTRGEEYRAAGWTRYDESGASTTGSGMGSTMTAAGTGIGAAGLATGMGTGGVGGPGYRGDPDGTPGNPPGTMLSRGADDALGTNMSGARPEHERGSMSGRDGTPGNPPGTMVSRGVDDVLGTNTSGARPENEWRHSGVGHGGLASDTRPGTPEHPPSGATATSSQVGSPGGSHPTDPTWNGVPAGGPGGEPDEAGGTTQQPDGTPGNPPGTKLSRGVDEVAGTNIRRSHPANQDGGPRQPQSPTTRG